MPFVSREDWERMQTENARMAEELRQWEVLGPYAAIGKELLGKVVELIHTDAKTEDIGRLAYEGLLRDEAETARRQIVAQYERDHRKALYAQVLAEVEAEEGPSLMEDVVRRLETDAKLAKELRASARKELTARADGVVADKITEEQQRVIDAETERQIELDRLDVSFALTGRLDLQDAKLLELLKPDDRLVIHFRSDRKDELGLVFDWKEDINGVTGWVLGDPLPNKRSNLYHESSLIKTGATPKDRFITLGSQMPDLVNGKTSIKPDTIAAGHPLAASWTTNSGGTTNYVIRAGVHESGYSYRDTTVLADVMAIDLQTRDLNFAENR